jgi:hypothetical protein
LATRLKTYDITILEKGILKRALRSIEFQCRRGLIQSDKIVSVTRDTVYFAFDLIHLDELWGHKVCIDFLLFRPEEMAGYLRSAGFEIEEIVLRDPYPDVEHQSPRAYIFAQNPASR